MHFLFNCATVFDILWVVKYRFVYQFSDRYKLTETILGIRLSVTSVKPVRARSYVTRQRITVFDLISAHFPISAQYDNV